MEVLLTRGDLSLVEELASLKDKLNVIRKRAKHVSKEQPDQDSQPEEHVPAREPGEEYREMMIRSCGLDYVFHDEGPIASAPIYRGGVYPGVLTKQ